MKSFKKFLAFIGIFVLSTIIFNIITGMIITYFYEPSVTGETSPAFNGITTFITLLSATTAILLAYKPFKKHPK